MLLSDFSAIGNKLLHIRKHAGLTQAEVAEAAGLSDRTYADIERGTANMRVATLFGSLSRPSGHSKRCSYHSGWHTTSAIG